jgi:flagellar biosynthesis GTPase FlhF
MIWVGHRFTAVFMIGLMFAAGGPYAAARSASVEEEKSLNGTALELRDRLRAEQELNEREVDENDAETRRELRDDRAGNPESDREAAERDLDKAAASGPSHQSSLQDDKSNRVEREDSRVRDNVREQEDRRSDRPPREGNGD